MFNFQWSALGSVYRALFFNNLPNLLVLFVCLSAKNYSVLNNLSKNLEVFNLKTIYHFSCFYDVLSKFEIQIVIKETNHTLKFTF